MKIQETETRELVVIGHLTASQASGLKWACCSKILHDQILISGSPKCIIIQGADMLLTTISPGRILDATAD